MYSVPVTGCGAGVVQADIPSNAVKTELKPDVLKNDLGDMMSIPRLLYSARLMTE